MTGFRVTPGGAQALWGLDPDLTCLGKVIGGGLPVGAYAGKREIMKLVAPSGPVYQAGTLSGNPLAMTAGLATLRALLEPGVFEAMAQMTAQAGGGRRGRGKVYWRPASGRAGGQHVRLLLPQSAGCGDHRLP